MRFDRLPNSTPDQAITKITTLGATHVIPKVIRKLGDHRLLELRRNRGLLTLRMLPSTKRRPEFTITLRRDGSIATPPGQEHRLLLLDLDRPIDAFQKDLVSHIALATIDNPKARNAFLQATASRQESAVKTALNQMADQLIQQSVNTAITLRGPRDLDPAQLKQTWNRLITTHFLDRDILELAATLHIHRYRHITAASYNFILRNKHLVDRENSSPELRTMFSYFVKTLPHNYPEKPIKDQDQLIQLAADIIGLPPEHRPYLTTAAKFHSSSTEDLQDHTKATCLALAEAGVQPHSREANEIASLSEHPLILQAGARTWSKWVRALRKYSQNQDFSKLISTKKSLGYKQTQPPKPHAPTDKQKEYELQVERASAYIQAQGSRKVAEAVPEWTPVEITKNPRTTVLKAMLTPGGKHAALTVRAGADGTITFDSSYTPGWRTPFATEFHLSKPLVIYITNLLLK